MNRRSVFTLALLLVLPAAVARPAKSAEAPAKAGKATAATATFAGGCFWCMQGPYDATPGVLSTAVGYTGGRTKSPTYEDVSSGSTGHAEAIRVVYDPSKVTYDALLKVFWHNIDPVAADRQFCDGGTQYRSAIFFHDADQKRLAEASKKALEPRFPAGIATQVVTAGDFTPAEEYHQSYYKKNPVRYKFYRSGCGRDRRLQEVWGKDAGGAH